MIAYPLDAISGNFQGRQSLLPFTIILRLFVALHLYRYSSAPGAASVVGT